MSVQFDDTAFDDLWQEFIDGTLDATGFAALERMLRDDPALCARAADLYAEHRLLGLTLRREVADRFVHATLGRVSQEGQDFSRRIQQRISSTAIQAHQPAPRHRWRWLPTALAAGVLIVIGMALRGAYPRAELPSRDFVATLIQADGCVWGDGAQGIGEGRRLAAGKLRLVAGLAVLRFDGGAQALLVGPAELQLDSAGSGTLAHGRVTVRAAEEAAGFTLHTPVSEVVDLGTEFAVTVDDDGATAIHVLEGEVEWRSRNVHTDGPRNVLHHGQALRVSTADDVHGQTVPFAAERIAAVLERTAPARDAGRLLCYEGFAYPFASTRSDQRQADGGTGWNGAWYRNSEQTTLEIQLDVAASLSAPPGFAEPIGGHLTLPPEKLDRPYRDACMRRPVEPIDLNADGVLYVSTLIKRAVQPAGDTHHWLRFMLVSEAVTSDRVGFGVLSNLMPQICASKGNIPGTVPIVPGRTYLFVAKLVTSRVGQDQMFLKVYDHDQAVDQREPAVWSVIGREYRFNSRIEAIHVYNGIDCGWEIDEIRLGTSWQSVTPRR